MAESNSTTSSGTFVVPVYVLVLVVAVVAGVLAGKWAIRNVDASLALQDQPVTVRIPDALPVTADVLNALDIQLDGNITTTVPIDQQVTLPVRDTLHVMASIDHDIPIKMNVPIHDTIKVNQVIHVDSKVEVGVLGMGVRLPVRGDIPIKVDVPISLNVPVNQNVHMKFTAPTDVKLEQALSVPLKTQIATTIPIKSRMDVPVRSALTANVTIPGEVKAVIAKADLKLPLRSLGFSNAASPSSEKVPANMDVLPPAGHPNTVAAAPVAPVTAANSTQASGVAQ